MSDSRKRKPDDDVTNNEVTIKRKVARKQKQLPTQPTGV